MTDLANQKPLTLEEASQPLAVMSGVVRGPAGNNDCRIYVGNLPPDIRTKDVEDVFYKYGTIRDIDLKNRRGGPPFAFIEFEDPRWAATLMASMLGQRQPYCAASGRVRLTWCWRAQTTAWFQFNRF